MSRCGARNWACNWTELGDWYANSNDNSNNLRSELLALCKSTITNLDKAEAYLPPDIYSSNINTIETIMKTMPSASLCQKGRTVLY